MPSPVSGRRVRAHHLVAAALLVVGAACSTSDGATPANAGASTGSAPAASTTKSGVSPTFLFVQDADNATVTSSDDELTVVLVGVDPDLTYFTDRPNRWAGLLNVDDFLNSLSEPGGPPNASLVWRDGETARTLVIELLGGEHDAAERTVTYEAKLVPFDGDDANQHVPDGEIGPVSLFIDTLDGKECSFQFANKTGQTLHYGELRPAQSEMVAGGSAPAVRYWDSTDQSWQHQDPFMWGFGTDADHTVTFSGDIPNGSSSWEIGVDGFVLHGCSGQLDVDDADGNAVATVSFDYPDCCLGEYHFNISYCAEGFTCTAGSQSHGYDLYLVTVTR